MKHSFSPSGWFTLIEIMIVIAMILIILSTSIFPFAYYMERARVEKTTDKIAGEWIITHQDIRGWRLHDGISHAYAEIEMNVWNNFITYSTYTGSTSTRVEYKKYTFDRSITILGFTGIIDPMMTQLRYRIAPPYATGVFSSWSSSPELYLSGVIMTVGYSGATRESGRARDILLRPYFD